jgi:hypothetical protein
MTLGRASGAWIELGGGGGAAARPLGGKVATASATREAARLTPRN